MTETPLSPEEKGFAVTSMEQLKTEYPIFNIWPTTEDNAEIDRRQQKAEKEAEALIAKNGGLTEGEVHMLNFYKRDEQPRNDM